MNKDLQRIKIAEICGTLRWSYDLPVTEIHHSVPDYLNDLNAMHKAEKKLIKKGADYQRNYLEWLGWMDDGRESVLAICHASAEEKAEAFLRTFRLWEE